MPQPRLEMFEPTNPQRVFLAMFPIQGYETPEQAAFHRQMHEQFFRRIENLEKSKKFPDLFKEFEAAFRDAMEGKGVMAYREAFNAVTQLLDTKVPEGEWNIEAAVKADKREQVFEHLDDRARIKRESEERREQESKRL